MKKTPNQIREELRRQMAHSHQCELEKLRDLLKKQELISNDYWKRYQHAKTENEELKEKVKQLEDWNNRLMEFMDMNDEDRKAALQEYAETAELNELYNGLYGRLLKHISIFV